MKGPEALASSPEEPRPQAERLKNETFDEFFDRLPELTPHAALQAIRDRNREIWDAFVGGPKAVETKGNVSEQLDRTVTSVREANAAANRHLHALRELIQAGDDLGQDDVDKLEREILKTQATMEGKLTLLTYGKKLTTGRAGIPKDRVHFFSSEMQHRLARHLLDYEDVYGEIEHDLDRTGRQYFGENFEHIKRGYIGQAQAASFLESHGSEVHFPSAALDAHSEVDLLTISRSDERSDVDDEIDALLAKPHSYTEADLHALSPEARRRITKVQVKARRQFGKLTNAFFKQSEREKQYQASGVLRSIAQLSKKEPLALQAKEDSIAHAMRTSSQEARSLLSRDEADPEMLRVLAFQWSARKDSGAAYYHPNPEQAKHMTDMEQHVDEAALFFANRCAVEHAAGFRGAFIVVETGR